MSTFLKFYMLVILGLLFLTSPFLFGGVGEKNNDYLIRGNKSGESRFELSCGDEDVLKAYELAIKTVESNIKGWQKGLLKNEKPVLIAGRGYSRPWTRDSSYNSYFAAGLMWGEVARNSLLSVLEKIDGEIRIGGQYWDCIGWSVGAWEYYCCSGDIEFLKIAYEAVTNSLEYFREMEFDSATGLYCGPGWSDGVAGYPEPYNIIPGASSFILDYANNNPEIDKIRMKALSTNCLYYQGYILAEQMAKQLGCSDSKQSQFHKKAKAIKKAINKHLWIEEAERYGYFLDRDGKLEESMEALGQSFAVLFGVASNKQAEKVLKNQYVSKYGVVCNWPKFKRFADDEMPRHCAAIWPQIQGFWALAAASKDNGDMFYYELDNFVKMAIASNDFREIYDPKTGKPNGGVQCGKQWESAYGQSWAATAYLGMIYKGVFGMRIGADGIWFDPIVKEHFDGAELRGVRYRDMTVDIKLLGTGDKILKFIVNGKKARKPFIDADMKGHIEVEIHIGKSYF